jgi:hypothetical protein
MFNVVVILASLSLAVGAGRAAAATTAPSVTLAGTTTSLVLGEPTVDYGQESAEQFSVTVVAATGTVAPTGTVTISSGSSAVCPITLAPVSATTAGGSCSPAASALPPGSSQLTAAYSGDTLDAASTSIPVTLAVSPSATTTTTTLTLSAPTVSYGDEETVQARIAVSAADSVAPTGTVTLSAGGGALCDIPVSVVNDSVCTLPSDVEFAPGSYRLSAEYSGPAGDGTSTSAAQTLTVTPANTTTSLALSAPTKAYGTEESERLSVVVSPEYGGTPGGAVTVSDGAKTPLCTVTLAAAAASATGSCVLSATALAPGRSELTASYAGNGDFARSTSVPAFLAISPTTTTTALSLSAGTVDYGDEQSEQVTVAVTSEYVGKPSGKVTVKSGTRSVCVATITAGKGTCALAASALAAGTADLSASYAGGGGFASSHSASRMLAVAKADPSLAVTMSAGTAVYGKEQGERLSVAVTPDHAGTPTGRVIVRSGSVTICQITLAAGKGGCSLRATQLAVGAAKITVSYGGDANFVGSASRTVTLGIAKAASTTTLGLSAAKVTYGKEQAERLSVAVAPQYDGMPAGRVTVRSGDATVCVITLAAGKGSCALSARSLRIGPHALLVVYPGCADFTSSASVRRTLTVVR